MAKPDWTSADEHHWFDDGKFCWLIDINGTALGNRANSARGFDAGEGELMWKLTIPCAALLMGLSGTAVVSHAAELDGRYVSNRGNQMRISGSSYTYIGRYRNQATGQRERGTKGGSVRSIGSGRYQFSGHLKYACEHSGGTLTCGGGRRIWWKQ